MRLGDIVYSKTRKQFGKIEGITANNKIAVQYENTVKIEDPETLRVIGSILRILLNFLLDRFFPK